MYEKRVQESENSLRLALDNARMGFWDEDYPSKKAVCDANWYRLLGMDYDPSLDPLKIWDERLHPDDRSRVHLAYEEYLEEGIGTFTIDYRIRRADDLHER